jgi:hypothetical protein
MLAVHLDNLLFLLLVGVAGLLRLLASKAGNKNEKPDEPTQTSTPIPRADPESDEQRIRKFLEALGQPTTSKPPPPITPRETARPLTEFRRKQIEQAARAARRRTILNPVPPLTTVPPEVPGGVTMPRVVKPRPREPKAFQPIAEPTFEVQQGQSVVEKVLATPSEAYVLSPSSETKIAEGKTEVTKLLSSPASLRNAIILREIFGPPRGLQPLDFIASA